jgi:predicted DNA-binding protein with PD1-like motif
MDTRANVFCSCFLSSLKKMNRPQKIFALRLHPGDDLKKSLAAFAREHNIEAGYIITCVGSLTACNLRYAGGTEGVATTAKFEILSLSGTLSVNGIHLHMALADAQGAAIGGHLLDGNIIYTTAEIVIGEAQHLRFTRGIDAETGYSELVVKKRGV